MKKELRKSILILLSVLLIPQLVKGKTEKKEKTEDKDTKGMVAVAEAVSSSADKVEITPTPHVNPGPRLRPTTTTGDTRRIRTGEGTLYITVNEDEQGLCEVFTTIGKDLNTSRRVPRYLRLLRFHSNSAEIEVSIVVFDHLVAGPNGQFRIGDFCWA